MYNVVNADAFLSELEKQYEQDRIREKNKEKEKNKLQINRGIGSVAEYFKKYYW